MRPQFATVGPLAAASATNIRTASTGLAGALVLNGSTVSNGVATLDKPRQVLFTTTSNSDSGKSVIITGTGWSGMTQNETVTFGNSGTYPTVLDYATVVSVVLSNNSVGNISIGTNAVAGSPWRQCDGRAASGLAAIQLDVTGTVNYTVQSTLDDPNVLDGYGQQVTSPQGVQWINSSDSDVVAATSNQQTNYMFAPVYVRVLLNSGTGSVTMTLRQMGE